LSATRLRTTTDVEPQELTPLPTPASWSAAQPLHPRDPLHQSRLLHTENQRLTEFFRSPLG
jgi:hypothetical protein